HKQPPPPPQRTAQAAGAPGFASGLSLLKAFSHWLEQGLKGALGPYRLRLLLRALCVFCGAGWISDVRAGTAPSYGNQIKSSCSLIAFNSDRAGVLGIVPLDGQGEHKGHVTHLGCHSGVVSAARGLGEAWTQLTALPPPDLVTDLDFSPFDDFLLATGSADRTVSERLVKVWRLPLPGQAPPPQAGLVLGPEAAQVEVLQFHPAADGVLVSAAGRAVKVWDLARQQPLSELEAHGDLVQAAVWSRDGALVGTACKDKQLRIFDPRAQPKATQGSASPCLPRARGPTRTAGKAGWRGRAPRSTSCPPDSTR
ncbi:Coronin-7, partial [Galemys pyrenaicus]